jgi:hypothetical protein
MGEGTVIISPTPLVLQTLVLSPEELVFEDELPELTDEEYDVWYQASFIPDGGGCRVGPKVKWE